MAIGVSNMEGDHPRRGCLFKLGLGLGLLFLVSICGQVIRPYLPTASRSAVADNGADVAPYKALTDAQKTRALHHMIRSVDKIEGRTYYFDISTNQSIASNGFYPYIGKDADSLWMRLVVRFSDSDWLFFDRMVIVADGIRVGFSGLKPQRDVGDGYVSEWLDGPVSKREYALLEAVAVAKNASLRLEGPNFQKDREISPREKAAIINVVMAYRALGAKAPPN